MRNSLDFPHFFSYRKMMKLFGYVRRKFFPPDNILCNAKRWVYVNSCCMYLSFANSSVKAGAKCHDYLRLLYLTVYKCSKYNEQRHKDISRLDVFIFEFQSVYNAINFSTPQQTCSFSFRLRYLMSYQFTIGRSIKSN